MNNCQECSEREIEIAELTEQIEALEVDLDLAKKRGEPGALERLKGREPICLDHLSALERAYVQGELGKIEDDCNALIGLCEGVFGFIAERSSTKTRAPDISAPQSETD